MMRWECLCQHAVLKHAWKVYTIGSEPALKQTGIQRGEKSKQKTLSYTTIYIPASCLNNPLRSAMQIWQQLLVWIQKDGWMEVTVFEPDCAVHVCVCVHNCSLARVCGFTVFCFWKRTALNNELPLFLLSHHCSSTSQAFTCTMRFPNSLSLSNPVMCVSQSFMWWQRPVVVCHFLQRKKGFFCLA